MAFKTARKKQAANDDDDDDEEDPNDADATTDSKGRFSIKILHGANGSLFGWMYTYAGEYENCPKLERLIKQSGSDVPDIRTPPMEIQSGRAHV